MGRRQIDAQLLINAMYKQPVLQGTEIAQLLGKHPSNTNRLIAELEKMETLTEITGYSRNRLFAFSPYIRLFE